MEDSNANIFDQLNAQDEVSAMLEDDEVIG